MAGTALAGAWSLVPLLDDMTWESLRSSSSEGVIELKTVDGARNAPQKSTSRSDIVSTDRMRIRLITY